MRNEPADPVPGNSATAGAPGDVVASQTAQVAGNALASRGARQQRSARRAGAFAPDFIIIGAMKAGTTSLCHYLAQFDEIGISRTKETDYFILEKNHSLGVAWYRDQFDLSRPVVGEASPNYTKYDIFPGVPGRIAQVAPQIKFLFIVRDPVARFASHYRHSWSLGHMRVEPAGLLASDNGRHMLECSRYGAQIDQYLAHFDRRQFLFLDFDELCKTPQRVGDQVADFLGIEHRVMQPMPPSNSADQFAQVPFALKRAARSKTVRRFDRFIPKAVHELVRVAYIFRTPDMAPVLEPGLLDEVADLLRPDARYFRKIAGREFAQWRV